MIVLGFDTGSFSAVLVSRGIDISAIKCGSNKVLRIGVANGELGVRMRLFSIHYADKCPGVDVSIANTNTNLAAQQRACEISPPAEFGVVSAKTAFSLVKDKTFVYDCPMNTKQLIEVVLAPGVFAYVNDAPAILPVSRGFLRYVIGTEGVKLAPKLGLTVNSKEVNTEMLNRIPDGGFGCFAGHSTVEVLNKGSVPVKELSIGDMVKVKGGKYSEVYSFGHKPSDVKASFLAIDAGLKKPLVRPHGLCQAKSSPCSVHYGRRPSHPERWKDGCCKGNQGCVQHWCVCTIYDGWYDCCRLSGCIIVR